MRSRWTLTAMNQLASVLVHFALRELVERHPAGPHASAPLTRATKAPTAADVAKLAAFTSGFVVLGSWAFGWLGAVLWWLATGRGPGGRLLRAGTVTPRPYHFRRTPPAMPPGEPGEAKA